MEQQLKAIIFLSEQLGNLEARVNQLKTSVDLVVKEDIRYREIIEDRFAEITAELESLIKK